MQTRVSLLARLVPHRQGRARPVPWSGRTSDCGIKALPTVENSRATLGRNIQLLWEQTQRWTVSRV